VLLRLWLLLVLALASVLAPSRTHARSENAYRVFEPQTATSRLADQPQVAGTHQANRLYHYEHAPGCSLAAENAGGLTTQIAGKGYGGHQLVDRVAGEIEGAVRQADRVLRAGGNGGTRWGAIYQHYAGTGHWLESVSRGNALQSIANRRLVNNIYVREAGALLNQGSLRGLRSAKGTLLRPDFQIPLGRGRLGVIDLTTPGQAAKISKYADPNTPFLLNVLYGQ